MSRLARLSDFDKLILAAFAALLVLATIVGTGLVAVPTLERSLPLCLFRAVTGIPCPGCGMAHALIYALNLRFVDSYHAHPLGLPLLAAWVWRLARLVRTPQLPNPRLAPWPAAASLAALAAAYATRLTS